MRFSGRTSRPLTAAALTLAAAAPALAQTLPTYGGANVTQCIPFANFQQVSFTDPPKLNFSIAGDSTIHTVTMDTGSVGVAISAIGLAIAAYGLARLLAAAPTGQIADRFGRRQALALGGLVTSAGNLWCALAGSFPEFVIARFVAGAGAGLVVTAGQIVLADISTPERRGRMMAVYQGSFIFAAGVGPFPGGLLAELGGRHNGSRLRFCAARNADVLCHDMLLTRANFLRKQAAWERQPREVEDFASGCATRKKAS